MKKRIIMTMLVAVTAAALGFNSYAQHSVTIPIGTNINELIPGSYVRPITNEEHSYVFASKATGVSSAILGGAALGCAFGSIAYDICGRQIVDSHSDWYGKGAKDLVVSKRFMYASISCAGAAAVLGITSLCLKVKVKNKTIVKTSTGGFAVEF